MNKKQVCGDFPEFCYKTFTCEEHAKHFIDKGVFRMGCIYSYTEIEDESRRDPTDGTGHTLEPGLVTEGWVSPNPEEKTIWTKEQGYRECHIGQGGNPKFCFCTSSPDVDINYIKNHFGSYIIKIEEPRKLAEEINDYFFNQNQKFLIQGCSVVYNKGEKLDGELEENERLDLAHKQKPKSFVDEREFRIVAMKYDVCDSECKFLDGEADLGCKFIEVNLGRKLSYLSLV